MKEKKLMKTGVMCLSVFVVFSLFLTTIRARATSSKMLTIGATWPMNTALGLETKKCFDVIIPMFNDRGGITIKGQQYKIKMITYDDKYKADEGRSAAERLVYRDKVKYILQLASAPTAATLPVTDPEKVIVLSGCTTEKIVDPNYKYCARTATSFTAAAAMWENLKKAYTGIKTMVTLAPDEEGGRDRTENDIACAKKYGISVLDKLFYPPEAMDFSPMATKIAKLKPELVTYPRTGSGTQFGLILKALYESGWRGLHMSPTVPELSELLTVTTRESMEGLVHKVWPTEIDSPPPAAAQLKNAYRDKYGSWSSVGVTWVNGFYCLMAAMRKADSLDSGDIIAALDGLKYDCPAGRAIMIKRPDKKNLRAVDFVVEQILTQWKEGKNLVVGTLSPEDGIKALETIYGYPGGWR
jgi:branched-chain amino acid transport system substrate-binding protein